MNATEVQPIVTAAWLAARIDDPHLRVVDATVHMSEDGIQSGRRDWEQAHIPGSVFADVVGELAVHEPYPMAIPPAETFAATVGALGIAEGDAIVVYDNAKNAWAARLWWLLRTHGADRVGVLDGGLRAWTEEGGAICGQPCRYPPTTFTTRLRRDSIVDRAAVMGALSDPGVVLVDALDARHYRGERADYGRAGHLPGAVNVPAYDLVDEASGRFLPLDELGARFERALGAPRVITYCGAGVGAASDALVLTALGHDRVAVYDGSLLEWARDPDLPLETSTTES